MLIGVIITYQEARFITRSIKSLQPYCKRIIVVDGAYADYPRFLPEHRSTDGTQEIARNLGAEVIESDVPWKDQVVKRNVYINEAKNNDIIIHIDADEQWVGKPNFRGDYPGYQVPVIESVSKKQDHWIRVFTKTPQLHYEGGHNLLFDGDNMLRPVHCPIMKDVEIKHCKYMRGKERIDKNWEYYYTQTEQEREFRKANDCP